MIIIFQQVFIMTLRLVVDQAKARKMFILQRLLLKVLVCCTCLKKSSIKLIYGLLMRY